MRGGDVQIDALAEAQLARSCGMGCGWGQGQGSRKWEAGKDSPQLPQLKKKRN